MVTPSHDPNSVTLQVASGGAVSKETMFFDFVAAPIIRLVSPLSGPVAGGTPISIVGNYFRGLKTTIKIGGAKLLCQTPMGPNRIDGIVPASDAGVGTATIVADDLIGGASTAPIPFTYDDSPDGGVPTSCSGGGSP